MLAIADCALSEAFLAPRIAPKTIDGMWVAGPLVRLRDVHTAFRSWTDPRQRGPGCRTRRRLRRLRFGRSWSRERRRQRGARHRTVVTTG